MLTSEQFTIQIEEAVLDDLRRRLSATRLPGDYANDDWRYGVEQGYLRELIDYYLSAYDWYDHARAMNEFSHFKMEIDGAPIHFMRARGKGPDPVPLVMSHGWPETFWDLRKVVGPLADPGSHGGDPHDAFDVIVPSLPGFGFSTPLTVPGVNALTTADLWVKLMRALGHERFAASGGDWGSLVTTQLGHKYPEHLIGIFLHSQFPLHVGGDTGPGVPPDLVVEQGLPAPSEYGPDEAGWYERRQEFFAEESGYSTLQSTRPQTIAFALNDSPAGLLAWMVEKRRAWGDTGGDVESRFTKDDLCTALTLYWATASFGTSARFYYEAAHSPWQPSHDRFPVVEVPTACAVFPAGEGLLMPRRWAERYYDLSRWTVQPSGGHFAPMEEPDAIVSEIRAHFRTRR